MKTLLDNNTFIHQKLKVVCPKNEQNVTSYGQIGAWSETNAPAAHAVTLREYSSVRIARNYELEGGVTTYNGRIEMTSSELERSNFGVACTHKRLFKNKYLLLLITGADNESKCQSVRSPSPYAKQLKSKYKAPCLSNN
jgi:hypothetical protein